MRNRTQSDLLDHILLTIRLLRPLVETIQRHDREHGRQVRDAMSSAALNAGEAFGFTDGNNRARLGTALGSAREVHVGVRVAVAWGYITEGESSDALAALDRLCGRLYGLLRR